MTAAIAIFVKTPGLSPLKTRLLASLPSDWLQPQQWIEDFYLQCAQCVAEAASATGAPVYWALAETEGAEFPAWQNLPQLAQTPSADAGLGTRMHFVMQQLLDRHGAGILLGADTPQLDATELRSLTQYLQSDQPRQALGPANDGGFWTYASNRGAPLAWWEGVRYSEAKTAADFRQQFEALSAIHTLSSQTDVDHYLDLSACLQALQQLPFARTQQSQLMQQLAIKLSPVGLTPLRTR